MYKYNFIFLILTVNICLNFTKSVTANVPENTNRDVDTNNLIPARKWITDLFREGAVTFKVDPSANIHCKKDYKIYEAFYRNQTCWAIRMKESSEWPSVGLLAGMTHHLGNWAECLRVNGETVTGQYCLVQTTFDYSIDSWQENDITIDDLDSLSNQWSAWKYMKLVDQDLVRTSRRHIHWAICMPASCTASDIQKSISSTLNPIFERSGLKAFVNIHPESCASKASIKTPTIRSNGFYYTRLLFIVLGCITLLASFKRVFQGKIERDKQNHLSIVCDCFAIQESYKNLITQSANSYPAISLLKVVTMLIFIQGHRWVLSFQYALFQTEELEQTVFLFVMRFLQQFYSGGFPMLSHVNIVDIFFFVSGFSLYHHSMKSIEKKGFAFLRSYITERLFKAQPTHILLILFTMNILPHLGEGPLWNWSMQSSKLCQSNWISNVFLMNNLLPASQQCLLPTWQLAADFQYSIFGIFLLWLISRKRWLGISITVFVWILSMIVTSLMTYTYDISGFYSLTIKTMRQFTTLYEINEFYFTLYPRVGPYILGIFLGITVEQMRDFQIKFTSIQRVSMLTLSIFIGICVQYYGFRITFLPPQRSFLNILFNGVYRSLYILPYFVLFGLYFSNKNGILHKILDQKIFVPLGRLVYCASLCSYLFQVYQLATQRSYIPTSTNLNMNMWAVADIFISFVFGFCLYIITEGPAINLLKLAKSDVYGNVKLEKKIM